MNSAEPNLTGMTFDEIAAKHGEEAAIQAGIAADPEWGPDKLDMSKARPATDLLPDLVEFVERAETRRARRECRATDRTTQSAYQRAVSGYFAGHTLSWA